MRLEWLEDVLTVIETGSFNAAAGRRHMTQPAFSRRIKSLEDYVGAELFDRSRKPVLPSPVLLDKHQDIQRLATDLRTLLHELRRQERDTENRITIAAQHSLSTLHAPSIVRRLSQATGVSISLRLGTREQCYAWLLERETDVVLAFLANGIARASAAEFCEHVAIGTDLLVPVCAPRLYESVLAELSRNRVNAVSYPPDAFLGRVVAQKLIPMLPPKVSVHNRVESAVTLAISQFALAGLGVAWIPKAVVAQEIRDGSLLDLRGHLPACTLDVVAVRLAGEKTDDEDAAWREICWQAEAAETGAPAD